MGKLFEQQTKASSNDRYKQDQHSLIALLNRLRAHEEMYRTSHMDSLPFDDELKTDIQDMLRLERFKKQHELLQQILTQMNVLESKAAHQFFDNQKILPEYMQQISARATGLCDSLEKHIKGIESESTLSQYIPFQSDAQSIVKQARFLQGELKSSLERFQQHQNIRQYQAEINSHFAHYHARTAQYQFSSRWSNVFAFIQRLKNKFDHLLGYNLFKSVGSIFPVSLNFKKRLDALVNNASTEFNMGLNEVKRDSTPFSHQMLLDTAAQLGYKGDGSGICFAYTSRWIEASLLHQEEQFNERMAFIQNDGLEPLQIEVTKNKVQKGQPLTKNDERILDALAFFDSLMLYQEVALRESIDSTFSDQFNYEQASAFAASYEIEQKGGLCAVFNKTEAFTQETFLAYLDQLREIIRKNNPPSERVCFDLSTGNHSMGLVYDGAADQWVFNDINQWPPTTSNQADQFAKQVTQAVQSMGVWDESSASFPLTITLVSTPDRKNNQTLKHALETVSPVYSTNQLLIQQHPLVFLASRMHNAADIERLVALGAHANKTNHGIFPLHLAAGKNDTEVMKVLLKHDATQVNQLSNGCSSLWTAAQEGHVDAVNLLIQHGAEVNQVAGNVSLLELVIRGGHASIVNALLEHPNHADVNKLNSFGSSLLITAIEKEQLEVVKVLLKHGANVEQADVSGETALYRALDLNQIEVADLLVQYNANLDAVLEMAKQKNNDRVLDTVSELIKIRERNNTAPPASDEQSPLNSTLEFKSRLPVSREVDATVAVTAPMPHH